MNICPLNYRNVIPNRYLITDSGEVFTTSTAKLYKLVPKIRDGYKLVRLATKDGRILDFRVHRLVKAIFDHDSDDDVDHKDGNKFNNDITNLEYVKPGENQRRAAKMGLYPSGENHFKSILSNDQVRAICELYSKGVNVRKAQRILGLENISGIDNIMVHILYRENWKSISKDYDWDVDTVRLKVYKKKHLRSIAYLITHSSYKAREIAKMYPQYDEKKLIQVIKKMREGKLYKSFMKEAERSTTIASDVRDGEGFTILIHKRQGVSTSERPDTRKLVKIQSALPGRAWSGPKGRVWLAPTLNTMDAALKGIVSDVIDDKYAPYTENNPDRKIDACLSAIGVYKRMCLDIIKVGGMNKIVIEKKRQLKEKYGQRIKAELKK